jgi:hypothetical protein
MVMGVLMLKFERVFKDDRLMRGLTGLNLMEFEALLPTFEIPC